MQITDQDRDAAMRIARGLDPEPDRPPDVTKDYDSEDDRAFVDELMGRHRESDEAITGRVDASAVGLAPPDAEGGDTPPQAPPADVAQTQPVRRDELHEIISQSTASEDEPRADITSDDAATVELGVLARPTDSTDERVDLRPRLSLADLRASLKRNHDGEVPELGQPLAADSGTQAPVHDHGVVGDYDDYDDDDPTALMSVVAEDEIDEIDDLLTGREDEIDDLLAGREIGGYAEGTIEIDEEDVVEFRSDAQDFTEEEFPPLEDLETLDGATVEMAQMNRPNRRPTFLDEDTAQEDRPESDTIEAAILRAEASRNQPPPQPQPPYYPPQTYSPQQHDPHQQPAYDPHGSQHAPYPPGYGGSGMYGAPPPGYPPGYESQMAPYPQHPNASQHVPYQHPHPDLYQQQPPAESAPKRGMLEKIVLVAIIVTAAVGVVLAVLAFMR